MTIPKRTQYSVGNHSSLFADNSDRVRQERLRQASSSFNHQLITAILTRQPSKIRLAIDPVLRYQTSYTTRPLDPYVYNDLMNNPHIAAVLNKPADLCIKLANIDTIEATLNVGPTRLDVVYVIASHWDLLVRDAELKGHRIPNLAETLGYANSFENKTALWTFIQGLSDERRAEAARLMQNHEQAEPISPIACG